LLSTLLAVPLLGAATILFIAETPQSIPTIKRVTLSVTMVNLAVSVYMWTLFDSGSMQLQFVADYASVSYCHLHVGLDGLSLYFVLLTTVLMPICVLASWRNVTFSVKDYMFALLLIESMLVAVFTVQDLLLFYVAFESVLVPLFFIVGTWGGGQSRIRAAFLLFLYTLAGSLFMLLAILQIAAHTGTTDMTAISLVDMSPTAQTYLWLAFTLAFAVKTPLVPFHLWLFRAHAMAPLAGSMILAGLVLKLATYGFLRVVLPLLPDATMALSPAIQALALVTLVYSSLATVRQTDVKMLCSLLLGSSHGCGDAWSVLQHADRPRGCPCPRGSSRSDLSCPVPWCGWLDCTTGCIAVSCTTTVVST
jgi:NADH-ubiquinone oxidoreductase chain 4